MKRDLIYLTLLAALFAAAKVMAQSDGATSRQELTPRTIEVGFTKTMHILFPAPVTYIDIGSMAIIAGKADGAENVVRVKAAVRDFAEETNLTVITEDGGFYTFDARYAENPTTSTIEIAAAESPATQPASASEPARADEGRVLLREVGRERPATVKRVLSDIYRQNRVDVKGIHTRKYGVEVDYRPLIRVVGVTLKEFRAQRIEILDHTAVIFTSRTTVDSFFRVCEEARITVPETMKYICNTEAVALYLQKYIIYRKRKISFADGSFTGLLELIIKHKAERFLLALSEPHKPELPEALAKLKIDFDPVILAMTVAADMDGVRPADYDMMALYSPSDVKSVVERFGVETLPVIATCGEATLRAALEAGLNVRTSAPSPEAPSMVKALDLYIGKLSRGEEVAEVEMKSDSAKEEFIRSQQSKLAKKSRVRHRP